MKSDKHDSFDAYRYAWEALERQMQLELEESGDILDMVSHETSWFREDGSRVTQTITYTEKDGIVVERNVEPVRFRTTIHT